MAYEKTVWKNNEAPKINATNLNKMENGIANSVETDSVARVTNVVSRNLFNLNAISIGGLSDSGEIIDTSSVTINNLDVSQGVINFTANSWRGIISDFIKVENGDTFTLNATYTADSYFYRIAGYDENKTFKSFFDDFYTFPHNINVPNGVSYIKIHLERGAEAGSINISSLQLEKGSTATPYTPYLNMQELEKNSIINNYSTGEQVIGKWIDGRNVYRKVYHITSGFTSNMNIPTGITNFGQPIKAYGWVNALGFKVIGGGYIQDASWPRFSTIVYQVGTNIELQLGDWIVENASDMMLVLEYTKTTD